MNSEFLEYFDDHFPEIARNETRYARLKDYEGIPDGEYALLEAYCTDPTCDCQNVMLAVVKYKEGFVASIRVILDPAGEAPKAFPDPFVPWSAYTERILDWLESEILADPDYVAILKRHYSMMQHCGG